MSDAPAKNVQLQPVGINVWSASNIRRSIKSKLDDLILRQKTDDTHKKKSKIIEAALKWYKGELKQKLCLKTHVILKEHWQS